MKRVLSLIIMLSFVLMLTGCNNSKNDSGNNEFDEENVKVNNDSDKGSNDIVRTIVVSSDTYALFFNEYNMDNAPMSMQITINYNELDNVISMDTKMNYGTEKGAQRFADMIKNDSSAFSKIFSDIKVIEKEYDSYLTASLDITYNDYYQEFSGIKSNVDEWIADSKKDIDSDDYSLYDSYKEDDNYYKETLHGYTIRFVK